MRGNKKPLLTYTRLYLLGLEQQASLVQHFLLLRRAITVKKSNITTVKDLMEVLDEERQARQIHLVLQTLDIANSSYESLSSPEPEIEPLQKKGFSKKESVKKEGHM